MWLDIPKILAKNNTFLDFFTVSLERRDIKYSVTYLMGKNHSPYVTGHDKYAMFIKWGDGNNAAIVVGQNPAVCQTIGNCRFHPDNTNWNIMKILRKMGYDGCIMVNTFSCIDTKGEKIKKIPEQGRNISVVEGMIREPQLSEVPIILACTNSNRIALDFIQFLKKYEKRLYMLQGYSTNEDSNTILVLHFFDASFKY